MKKAEEFEGAETVAELGKPLVEELTAMEDSLVQKRTVDGQTVINFPSRLNFHYTYLRGAVDGWEGGTTRGAHEMFSDLSAKWSGFRALLNTLLGERLDEFNGAVQRSAMPAIVVPGAKPTATS